MNILGADGSPVMRRFAGLLLIGALLALNAAADPLQDDSAYFQSIGDLESVPDGVVTALAEDQRGLLWIGTTRGLVRHDGYTFRRHVHRRGDDSSLGGNLVRALMLADDGRLWVGTDADGVSILDPRTERYTVLRHDPLQPGSIPAGAVMALAQAHDGAVWLGTRGGGLARVDPDGQTISRYSNAEPDQLPPASDHVHALLFDHRQRLWIGTRDGLMWMDTDSDNPRPLRFEGVGHGSDPVYSLLQVGEGELWVGTQGGQLLLVDPDSMEVRRPQIDPGTAPGTADTISAMVHLDNDEIWLGRASGIEVRDPASGALRRRIRHDPARSGGLASNEIRALLQSRSGLLWIGGFGGGVQRHDPANRWARVLRGEDGFGGVFDQPDVSSVLQRRSGEIWMGTRGRGVAILDRDLRLIDGYPVASSDPSSLGVGWITALAEDSQGTIWLGSRDGLRRQSAGDRSFQRFGSEQGLDNLSVRRLFVDSRDVLWIGTGDGLFRWDPRARQIERLTVDGGEALIGEFNAISEDRSGRIWIGSSRGLFQSGSAELAVRRVLAADGHDLLHPSVVGLLVDSQDRLWVDTVEGLYRKRLREDGQAAFEPISSSLGIAGDFGANLLEDRNGRIWSHRYVYEPASDAIHILGRADGVDIGTGWFRSYAALDDGRLLFGGSRGVLVISTEGFRPWSYQPPLVVTTLRVAEQLRAAPQADQIVVLAPGERSISVEFAALDFSAPESLSYAYRLEGVDQTWTEVDASQRLASYRNLAPGHYRLQVRASNRSQAWSENQLDIAIHVQPSWWQSGWFIAVVSLLLLGVLVLAVRVRIALIRRHARELEALVALRTAELSRAKASAEQALAELGQAQHQLVEAENLASRGALVAGVAHEINTPIGIAITAASHLKDSAGRNLQRMESGQLTRGDLRRWSETLAQGSALILSSLQRAGRLISSFKQVAVDQSSEQRRQFDLRGFLIEVRTALEPSFKRGGHRFEIDCPPAIEMDTFPGALFQVLTNLVNNSLIHGFASRREGLIRIDVERQGKRVLLRYRDDGEGMSAEVAARAFDPFFTTRRSAGGSGLGLHLVYNLSTRLLAANIDLRSTPGEGSEFDLDLPLRAPDLQPAVS